MLCESQPGCFLLEWRFQPGFLKTDRVTLRTGKEEHGIFFQPLKLKLDKIKKPNLQLGLAWPSVVGRACGRQQEAEFSAVSSCSLVPA